MKLSSLYTTQNRVCKAKLVLLGPVGSGKTTLLNYQIWKKFDKNIEPTIGATFGRITKEFPSQKITLDCEAWDTAGAERFLSLTRNYFRNADVMLLVFDVNDPNGLENIKNIWLPYVKQNAETLRENCLFFLVANKIDLLEKMTYRERNLILKNAQEFALESDLIFAQVSSLIGVGVESLFDDILDRLSKRVSNREEKDPVERNIITVRKSTPVKQKCSENDTFRRCTV